jgi:hypothetical protein
MGKALNFFILRWALHKVTARLYTVSRYRVHAETLGPVGGGAHSKYTYMNNENS